MTNVKKVVAVLLAFLMIFSSVSVLASAWDASVDDGKALEISTKFFKNVNGEWVETTKVRPGDTVEARVYLGTDYYSNDSALLFFYDKDFFNHSYSSTARTSLVVNPDSAFATTNEVSASIVADPNLNSQIAKGYIDSAFTSEYGAFGVTVDIKTPNGQNAMYDDSTWLFKIVLTVADDAGQTETNRIGDLFVQPTTVQSTTQTYGAVNVPKGPATGTSVDVWAMWLWDADVTLSSQPVTTHSTVTFDANGGAFAADNADEFVIEDAIDADIDATTIPSISRDGYSFMGWIDAADTTPTYEEIIDVPATMPEDELVLNAYWMENVDITFDTDGGSDIAPLTNVTPYADFADVAEPTKAGYTFVGWDVRGGDLPETYPDVDTTYTAIWALNVTVSFDTDGGSEVPSVSGYEGEEFDASAVAEPTREGGYFIGWSPELPTVFPAQDTTYTALYDTYTYKVNYYVDNKFAATVQLEYGATIPTNIRTIKVPDGKYLDVWYTDAALTQALASGETMGVPANGKSLDLYTTIKNYSYDAIFMLDADTEYTRVETVFEEEIIAPADPAKAGYVFVGWDPYPATFDQPNDMVFTAVWEEAENAIQYIVDNQKYELFEKIPYGADLEIPADPDKEGYTFAGWTWEKVEIVDGEAVTTPLDAAPATMPEYGLVATATWTINQYTITFDTASGTAVDSITKDYNADITEDTTTTRTGYTFTGWVDESGATVTVPTKMPAKDMKLTATWKINQYTITFVDTGDVAYEAITKDYLADVGTVADPVKTGYTFTGWIDANGDEATVPAQMPLDGMTLTATWDANSYDAVFDANGGYFDDDATVTSKTVPTDFDEDIVAPADPKRAGYVFDSWTPAVGKMNDVNGKTFTAVWTEAENTAYTVEVYTMGTDGQYGAAQVIPGTGKTNSTATYNISITDGFKVNTEKTTGYDAASNTANIAIAPEGNSVIKVYIDRIEYTLSVDVDGTVTKTGYLFGEAVTAPATPTKEGWTFDEWVDANNAAATVPTEMPANDVYVKATWTVNSHTVTWIIEGVEDVDTYNYGDTIIAPEASKTGYSFKGWTPEFVAGTTMPDEDLEFTAVFEANSYNAVFDANDGYFDNDTTVTSKTVPTAFDADIVAPADPVRIGYVFGGWTPTVGKMDDVNGKTFTAVWKEAENTAYTVEVYTMGTDGQYGAAQVIPGTGKTNSTATYNISITDGFKVNAEKTTGYDAASNTANIAIAPEGNSVIKVYIDRIEYTLSVDVDGTVTETKYLFGQTVSVADPEDKTGYTFKAWSPAAPATMPAEDMTITATWTPNSDTAYKVVVNYKDLATGDQTKEFDFTGTTDNAIAIVEEIPATPAENTEYVLLSDLAVAHYELDTTAANDLTGKTVKYDGSTVVNLYYKAVNYTATFDAVDGDYEAAFTDGSETKDVILPYNSLVKENAPADPVRAGYTFAGWKGVTAATRLATSRTFYANWTANPYNVTWVIDTDKTVEETYSCDALINKQAAPSKTGYTFDGWTWEKLDENGAVVETIAEPTTMPAYDVKVTANWKINQYTITFDTDGGTSVTAITKDYNADITENTTTTKTGYTFTGWVDENGAAVTVPAKMPAEDMTLKATWSINSYTLSFNTDGGTTIADIKQEYNTSVSVPSDPTKTGYTFDGWVDKDGNETTVATVMPAEDITYTATWKINQYTITFNSDGGTDVASVTADYNSDVNEPTAPTKDGYTFKGWATTKGETDEAKKVDFPVKVPVDGATYYAIWVINKYTIEFNSQGGSDVASVEADYNSSVAAPTAPTKEGYTFGGWATTAGVTDAAQAVTFPVTMPLNGTTYYAIWTIESYKVNWSSDGTIVKTETVAYNGTLTPPEVAKKGYNLEGWTGMPADKTMDDIGDNGADVTFTANWKANTYDATFNSNDGAWEGGVTTKTVPTVFDTAIDTTTVGLTKDDAAAPTRAGYTFNGWEPAVGNMTEEGMTFEATWIANGGITYTVETYIMNTDGTTYTMTSKTYEGVTDKLVEVTHETLEGFTPNTEDSVLAGTVKADGSLVLKVYYDRNSYTVTTAVTDGETSNPVSYYYESTVVVPAEAVKAGYTFDGWYDGTTKYAAGATFKMPARNVTLTGSFDINQYTVAFDSQGGTAVSSVTADYDSDVAEPTAPTKTGYTFKGWATAAGVTDEAQAVTFPVKVPVNGTTYYAIWDANEYKITFDSDGGSAVEAIVADYDTAITAPANPTKAGYDFAGWVDESGAAVTVPAKMPAGDMALKATWTPKQYTVTFYRMDRTTVEYTLTADYKSEYNVPSYTETGYTFNGWVLEDGSASGLTAGGVTTIPLDGGKYYPDVTINSYDVNFRPNGGKFEDDSTAALSFKVEYGATITAPADPTREGYTFKGWSPAVPDSMPARTQNFVAQWEIETYTVIWDNDGVTTTETYEYGEELRIPAPTKTGYTLNGWTGLAADATTMPDVGDNGATVTYKADWSANIYDAIFNSNDGAWEGGVTTKTVPTAFDSAIDTTTVGLTKDDAAAPTRAGYTFNGWEPAVGNMTKEGGMTFEATWIANGGITYTVETYTMNTDGTTYTMTSKTYEGVTDAPVDVTPKTVEAGFSLNTEDSVLTGTVQADGSLVLKIYLDRLSYTLKTVVDGNETSTIYVYGAAVSVATPTKEGHTFSGWDDAVPATMPAHDVTLSGSFAANTHDVIYMVDGVEYDRVEDVAFDTAVIVLAPLTKEGYTFSGWDKADFTMPDEDVTISGSWTINKYDVIYIVDGVEYDRVEDVAYGTEVTVLAPLTKTGYTFSGWDKADFTMPDSEVTINGSWTAINFTVTWVDGIDTTEDQVDTYIYEAEIKAPATPVKAGYTFAGWKDADGAMFADGATMPAANVVYTAQWTANDGVAYTVETYKMNLDGTTYAMTSETLYGTAGETATAETPEIEGFTHNPAVEGTKLSGEIAGDGSLVLKVYYDRNKVTVSVNGEEGKEYFYEDVITEPETPVDPDGGEFKGWEDEDGNPVEFPYTVPDEEDGEITITPIYYYTVKFISDNAEVFSVENRAGTTYTVPSASKTGYTFKGWTLNGADAGLTVGAEAAIPVGGAEYVAKWEGNDGIEYTVETYKMNLDGTTYTMTSETLTGKAGEIATAETPDVEGFTHNPDAEGTKLSGEIAGDGSLVLKVYYDRNEITVDVNGEEDKYFYGEEIEEPTEPTPPEGNEFSGWEDEDGNTVEFPYTVPDEEDKKITITPVFTPLDYTVTFIADGVTVDSFKVTYGTTINAPAAPAKEGYYFVDWSPAVPAAMPAEDLTFTAVYDTISTGVEYYVNDKLVGAVSLEYGAVIPTEIPTFTKQPVGYTFDGWYTADGTKLADGATLGTDSIKLYATETANSYDAVFNANDGAFADGSKSVTVPTDFDAEIIAPADPTREGYEFGGWDPYVGTMDSVDGMTFEATWVPVTDAYTVTYYVDGVKYQVFQLSAEDEMEIPAEPDKEGYTFKGWAETADSTTTVTPPATMPAGNLEYYAVFTINNYTVTFYDYEALDASPYKSDAPTAVVGTANYDYAETIEFPADEPALDSAYFTFKGWSATVDGEVIADLSKVTMGAGDVAYYAVYDRVQVKLVPAEGSTTVIERDGVRESYNDGDTVTADPYATPDSYDYWFVYGVDDFFFTGDDLKANYLAVLGDGTIEVTETEFGCGTGTHIKVIDNVTGKVVEEFDFVIFGDLNGDTLADYADASIMDDEAAGNTSWQFDGPVYLFKAADLDGDQFMIDYSDASIMDDVAAGNIIIDQTIGYYI